MFENMGIQWAATLLGCIAAILIPVPIAFYLYGPKLRQKSKWALSLPSSPIVPKNLKELEKETEA